MQASDTGNRTASFSEPSSAQTQDGSTLLPQTLSRSPVVSRTSLGLFMEATLTDSLNWHDYSAARIRQSLGGLLNILRDE